MADTATEVKDGSVIGHTHAKPTTNDSTVCPPKVATAKNVALVSDFNIILYYSNILSLYKQVYSNILSLHK